MLKNAVTLSILFLVILFVLPAHSGRTDSKGGHNGPNGYHYHNGGSSSDSGSGSTKSSNTTPLAEKVFILFDQSEDYYHQKLCDAIKEKKVSEISKVAAINSGYKACTICEPD